MSTLPSLDLLLGKLRIGTVSSFDDATGLGEVTSLDGVTIPFHCTEIADGSRRIERGRQVAYLIRPGHCGRIEASCLTPL
ncbi:MAG: hypothetical protein M1519_03405 [Actinobacteria bacterium]|jgi:cold shock CspA family protein|nr:hypothetical protein [Actinomycetota bacterium]